MSSARPAAPHPPPGAGAAAEPSRERGRRDPRWLGLLVAVVLVAGGVAVARPWVEDDGGGYGPIAQVEPVAAAAAALETAPEVGKLAPNFRLRTAGGEEVRLAELRGRPVFLNFWATWCLFCVGEMSAMQKLADRYDDRVAVLGVNVGEDAERARRFAAEAGVRYPLLLDADRAVTEAYRVRAMPTSLFVDGDGVIRSAKFGPLTPPEMEEHLAPLLAPTG